MTTESPPRLLTAEEFWHLPDPRHGGKMELVRGEVVCHMPVGRPHSRIAGRLIVRLGTFVELHSLGEVGPEWGFLLARDPDIVRAPDVHFVRVDRLPDGDEPAAFFDGPPDLAIEVTSPGDTDDEVQEKVAEYLTGGTPRIWVVRPSLRTVAIYNADGATVTRRDGDDLTSSDANFQVDGFELRVADVFA